MRGLLIADEDLDSRNQLASLFAKENYAVTVTNSLANALDGILKKTVQVVLLSGEFDEPALTKLIHIIRQCNRNLTIILVSDEMPLSLVRRVRKEGIFYHALKPVKDEDRQEIRQAVRCAFANQSHSPEFEHPYQNKEVPMKASKIILATLTVVMALCTPTLAVDTAKTYNSGFLVLAFVGICALIVVAQLLPAIRSLLSTMKNAAEESKKAKTGAPVHLKNK